MKRAFLYGLGSLLIVGILGLLARFSTEAIVLALSLMPISVVAIVAARHAPPNRSRSQAIIGWLLGSLAIGALGGAFIAVLNLAALLRRSGLIATDIWTAISVLWIGLLPLAWLLYMVRVRGRQVAKRAASKMQREKDRREPKARRQLEARKQREWWEVLEVDPKSGLDEIRRAYLRKIRMYHPDRLAGLGPELVQLSESRTLELNLAFDQAKRSAMNNHS
jgi:hypothetical protein